MKFDWHTAFITTGAVLLAVFTVLSLIATIAYFVAGETWKMMIAVMCFSIGAFLLAGFVGGAA